MDELENRLGAILSDPEMMGKIMSFAQTLQTPDPPTEPSSTPPPQDFPQIDLSMLQKLTGAARQTGIDPKQKALLNALAPYLNSRRLGKLERAMRAAKMAAVAGLFLNPSDR